MIPGNLTLELYRGDTGHWVINLWTDAAKTLPADLTGVTVLAQIRDVPRGTVMVPLTTAITLPNTIDMQLSAANSTLLPPTGWWDMQLTYSPTAIFTILRGPVLVTNDVSF